MIKKSPPVGSDSYDGYFKYDEVVAKTYEDSRMVERHWLREDFFVKAYVKQHRISALLDIPVGTGRFFEHYTDIPIVVGVDISDDMLQVARTKKTQISPNGHLRIEKGDVFQLQYEDDEFDTALVFRLFHLLPPESLDGAIRELCRVASKHIVVQTYVPMTKWQIRWNTILNRMRAVLFRPDAQVVATQQPWLHIQSYNHHQEVFDLAFRRCGFFPSIAKRLDTYGNLQVRATVYSLENQK